MYLFWIIAFIYSTSVISRYAAVRKTWPNKKRRLVEERMRKNRKRILTRKKIALAIFQTRRLMANDTDRSHMVRATYLIASASNEEKWSSGVTNGQTLILIVSHEIYLSDTRAPHFRNSRVAGAAYNCRLSNLRFKASPCDLNVRSDATRPSKKKDSLSRFSSFATVSVDCAKAIFHTWHERTWSPANWRIIRAKWEFKWETFLTNYYLIVIILGK